MARRYELDPAALGGGGAGCAGVDLGGGAACVPTGREAQRAPLVRSTGAGAAGLPGAPGASAAPSVSIGPGASLPLNRACQHLLLTGATGGGKTTSLQVLLEGFSRKGIPCIAPDAKGDLSALAKAREGEGGDASPVRFWDVFGERGLPVKTSIHELGPLLLGRMLGVSDVQAGILHIASKFTPPYFDEPIPAMHITDLRALLSEMTEYAPQIRREFGHASSISIAALLRQLLVLDVSGGSFLFGEPALSLENMLACAPDGRGIISLIHAPRLIENPRTYSSFMIFLLTELYRTLPEAGALAKPRVVLAIDEAHLLFDGSPALLETIERVIRLCRSKGVAIILVSQSPKDIPASVAAQLNSRMTHSLRAYTLAERRALKAVAESIRLPDGMTEKAGREWLLRSVTSLAVGECLASFLDENGVPTPARRVRVNRPRSQIGAITEEERERLISADPLCAKYRRQFDDRAAFRVLCERLVSNGRWDPRLLDQFREIDKAAAKRGGWLRRVLGLAA
jgi:uncharacterized protein